MQRRAWPFLAWTETNAEPSEGRWRIWVPEFLLRQVLWSQSDRTQARPWEHAASALALFCLERIFEMCSYEKEESFRNGRFETIKGFDNVDAELWLLRNENMKKRQPLQRWEEPERNKNGAGKIRVDSSVLKLALYSLLAQKQKVDLHFIGQSGQSMIAETLQGKKMILHLTLNEWPTLEALLAENANDLTPEHKAFFNNLLAARKLGGYPLTAEEQEPFMDLLQTVTAKPDSGNLPWVVADSEISQTNHYFGIPVFGLAVITEIKHGLDATAAEPKSWVSTLYQKTGAVISQLAAICPRALTNVFPGVFADWLAQYPLKPVCELQSEWADPYSPMRRLWKRAQTHDPVGERLFWQSKMMDYLRIRLAAIEASQPSKIGENLQWFKQWLGIMNALIPTTRSAKPGQAFARLEQDKVSYPKTLDFPWVVFGECNQHQLGWWQEFLEQQGYEIDQDFERLLIQREIRLSMAGAA
jgi:hypothetical protein